MFVSSPDIEICPWVILTPASTVLNLGRHRPVSVGFLGFERFQSYHLVAYHLLFLDLVRYRGRHPSSAGVQASVDAQVAFRRHQWPFHLVLAEGAL